MLKIIRITTYFFIVFSLFACDNRETEEVLVITLPTVATSETTEIQITSAVGGGEITDDGNSTILAKGVCWSTSPAPTLADNFTENGLGTASFTSEITDLLENTTYYLRAYATNAEGTGYGEEITFTTEIDHIVFEGDVVLESQDDVDSFGQNGYTKINGNLEIGVFNTTIYPRIENLEPLSSLIVIEGKLVISSNYNLETLEGLNGITSIGGNLILDDNRFLEDVKALGQLEVIGGNLGITDCWLLENIDALENISSINNLGLVANRMLENINGLTDLTEITGKLYLESNDKLTNIDGLSNVQSIGGSIIFENGALENIDGLKNITSVNDKIWFINQSITNINGFQNLTSVKGDLALTGNFSNIDALSSLISVKGIFRLEAPI